MFILHVFSHSGGYWFWVVVCLASLAVHELAHAMAARCLGVARRSDPASLPVCPNVRTTAAALGACLVFGMAWGSFRAETRSPGMRRSLTALAGPFANFLLAAGCCVAFGYCSNPMGKLALENCAQINLLLGVFNLAPVPPLDGWELLETTFPACDRTRQELKNGLLAGLLIVCCSFQFLVVLSDLAVTRLGAMLGVK